MTRGRSGSTEAFAAGRRAGRESIATATINSAGSVRTRMAWPATNMAVSPVRKTASSEYPLLRQPGCQVHHLTRGFADRLHRRGALFRWGVFPGSLPQLYQLSYGNFRTYFKGFP